ncbi:MAG: PKD domain-containing protein [Chloroflexi bacterium]|nr:PKD domain-containing protein [Chloroflexota bacterium]
MRVEDANGMVGQISGPVIWAWDSPPAERGFSVRLDEPTTSNFETGEDVRLAATGEAVGFGEPETAGWDLPTSNEIASLVDELLSGNIIAEWDFGDGTKSVGPVPGVRESFIEETDGFDLQLTETHVYEKPGSYNLTLTVTDERWDRVATVTQAVTVVDATAPEPTPTAAPVAHEDGIRVDIHRVTARGAPGYGWVTGEITNTNFVPVRIRSMYLELSDGTRPQSAFLLFDILEPGQTTPFIEQYQTTEGEAARTVLGVAEWRVDAVTESARSEEVRRRELSEQIGTSVIQVTELNTAVDDGFEHYQIRVTLTNNSSNMVRLSARVTLRENGEVIYVGHRSGSANDRAPGESETFFLGTTIELTPRVSIEITPLALCRGC